MSALPSTDLRPLTSVFINLCVTPRSENCGIRFRTRELLRRFSEELFQERNLMRQTILRTAALLLLVAACAADARAQSSSSTPNSKQSPPAAGAPTSAATEVKSAATEAKVSSGLFAFDEMQRQLREQREEIDELRA